MFHASCRKKNAICVKILSCRISVGRVLSSKKVPPWARSRTSPSWASPKYPKFGVRSVIPWSEIEHYVDRTEDGEYYCEFFESEHDDLQRNWRYSDIPTIGSRLRKLTSPKDLSEGKRIHDRIIKSGLQKNVFLGNMLVQMYSKCGAIHGARALFDHMYERNCYTWNIMMSAYTANGLLKEALQLFHEMPQQNVVSWNLMIMGHLQHGQLKEALELFDKMPERNSVSWTVLITAYTQQGQLQKALQLFKQMPQPDIVTCTAMIKAYAQEGHFNEALQLFQQMPHRDVISWTAMLDAYVQKSDLDGALDLFQQMVQEGIKPDEIIFVSLLDLCATMASLSEGKKLHIHISSFGFESDAIQNALLNMYAKCGSVNDAHYLFAIMPKQDVFSWTSMIIVHGQHGHGEKALKLLQCMQLYGVLPDGITFSSIFNACSHAGMVDEAFLCIMSMSHLFTPPTLEHYGGMLDNLGRRGMLEEAEDLLYNMPFDPSARLWLMLFRSCKVHMNIEQQGKHIEGYVLELDLGCENQIDLDHMMLATSVMQENGGHLER